MTAVACTPNHVFLNGGQAALEPTTHWDSYCRERTRFHRPTISPSVWTRVPISYGWWWQKFPICATPLTNPRVSTNLHRFPFPCPSACPSVPSYSKRPACQHSRLSPLLHPSWQSQSLNLGFCALIGLRFHHHDVEGPGNGGLVLTNQGHLADHKSNQPVHVSSCCFLLSLMHKLRELYADASPQLHATHPQPGQLRT